MQPPPDLQRLLKDLANGNRLSRDVVLRLLMLNQLGSLLSAEVKWQNHLVTLSTGNPMREVRELAAGMKEAVASLRKDSVDAKGALAAEMQRAKVNANKVKSLAADLKEANLEVESFLGETGSNFSSSEDSNTQAQTGEIKQQTDRNGVTTNTETSQ